MIFFSGRFKSYGLRLASLHILVCKCFGVKCRNDATIFTFLHYIDMVIRIILIDNTTTKEYIEIGNQGRG